MSPLTVSVLIHDGFSNMVLACLLEPLRALRDQMAHPLSWQVFSPDGAAVESSSGLRVSPDGPAARIEACDLLVVISGYGFRAHAEGPVRRVLAQAVRRARMIVGADTAAWLLADLGLLDGARATIHWQVLGDLAQDFPQIRVSHDRFVADGTVWTCGGASTALDLILHFIQSRYGPTAAFDVSTMFLHDASRQREMQRGPALLGGRGSDALRAVLNLMAGHVESPLPLDRLARQAGLSERSLNRLFRHELQMAPGRYYRLLRLSRARDLAVETDLSLQEIALRAGFETVPSLCRAFKQAFGYSIGKVRAGSVE
ncbi:helix-turn-helix domain-containing protein [uncultured Paracoccus sp.]|uniref:GlxA family transcriptional regulator n=1 Tax=uncultured Paracoccus sp. TaxID=189685 RepID=UPI002636B24C|nr:helix-turn-helix domain-containing protein [uncultured Paracoccus sp.]